MSKEASVESIQRLISNCDNHIILHGQAVENTISLYKICVSRLKDPQFKDNESLLKLKSLLEVILTYSIAEMEMSAILRANFKERKDNLYGKTLLLQTFRVISEATKALFGFEKDKRNGFWIKIKEYFNLSPYFQEVKEIETGVNSLTEIVINKVYRDIASHYNSSALNVADAYSNLDNEDIICHGINKYEYVIARVSFITNKLLQSLDLVELAKTALSEGEALSGSLSTDLIWRIETAILKPKLIDVIRISYLENAEQLDHSVSLCRYVGECYELAERMGADPEHNQAFQCYQRILNAVALVLFMLNDALSSAIALTDSESFWESRMHLKRLDVSAYEALNKIVGFDEACRQESLFNAINQVIDDLPESNQSQFTPLKDNAASIINRFGFNNASRRNAFVHYRKKKKVWLIQTYDNLTAISVPEALAKIIELRKLTTDIVLFVKNFSDAFSIAQDRKFKEEITQKFQPLRDIVNKYTNEEDKASGLKILDDMNSKILNLSFLRGDIS